MKKHGPVSNPGSGQNKKREGFLKQPGQSVHRKEVIDK